jgi:hypothetical protein
MQIYNEDLVTEFAYEWAEGTEKIVGAMLGKKGVIISDTSKTNIQIRVNEKSGGKLEIDIMYRDSLRFTEMGAGRGYHKGQRITAKSYRDGLDKARIRKKILMKPIFGRIAMLHSVVAAKLIRDIRNDFNTLRNYA